MFPGINVLLRSNHIPSWFRVRIHLNRAKVYTWAEEGFFWYLKPHPTYKVLCSTKTTFSTSINHHCCASPNERSSVKSGISVGSMTRGPQSVAWTWLNHNFLFPLFHVPVPLPISFQNAKVITHWVNCWISSHERYSKSVAACHKFFECLKYLR